MGRDDGITGRVGGAGIRGRVGGGDGIRGRVCGGDGGISGWVGGGERVRWLRDQWVGGGGDWLVD